jgi:hypothetical protein
MLQEYVRSRELESIDTDEYQCWIEEVSESLDDEDEDDGAIELHPTSENNYLSRCRTSPNQVVVHIE